MATSLGLRDRKKLQTRQRIADVAAALFAERGYDSVSMVDVARSADVSDQTVYNYFATKPDLVLDRAEEIRSQYNRAVRGRSETTAPAEALAPLLHADIGRYRAANLDEARGEFLAQSVASATFRRFALEERERQTHTLADAIAQTSRLPGVIAHTHAAALVAAVMYIHDQIGAAVLDRRPQNPAARRMRAAADTALADLARSFTHRHTD